MAGGGNSGGRTGARDDGIPALAARPGGLADRFAGRVGRHHPVGVFFAAVISGFALLAAFAILLGLLVTDVLVPIHADRVGGRALRQVLGGRPDADPHRRVGGRDGGGRRAGAADPRRPDRRSPAR